MSKHYGMFVAAISFVAGSAPSQADSQLPLPLTEGWHWEYATDGGDVAWIRDVTGTATVLGRPTIVLRSVFGGTAELEQYWSADPDGNVLFHGFRRFDLDVERAYDPPFLNYAADLELGRSWSTTSMIYDDLAGTEPTGETTFELTVLALDEIVVPAGVFEAWGLGYDVPASERVPDGRAFDVMGLPSDPAGGTDATRGEHIEYWIVPGLGEVRIDQYRAGSWSLVRWEEAATPTQTVSWSALRTIHRAR